MKIKSLVTMENTTERMLPIIVFEGTEFYVDTRLNEFREKDAPWNRISMNEINASSEGDVTGLVYDKKTKNVYDGIVDPDHIPGHVKLIIIPPLIELDPVGMARKYGLPDNEFTRQQPGKEATPEKKLIRHKRGRHL